MSEPEKLAKELAEKFLQSADKIGIRLTMNIKGFDDMPYKYKKILIFMSEYLLEKIKKGEFNHLC